MVHSVSCSIIATLSSHVNLPNGEIALVIHIGTTQLSEKLILYNVLCVLSFSFNLISVSQLAKSIFYCLIFFENLCFIQDLILWSTIGLGREFNGLYLLDESSSASPSFPLVFSVNKVQPHE